MKNFSLRRTTKRYPSFTLVELLVVIAIIAILAAVTMSVGSTVLNKAKEAKAQNAATQIQTATLSYYTEYSVYPTPSGASAADFMLDDTDSATQWGPLIECLSGMISPSTGTTSSEAIFSNTRQIAFLTFKASDVGNGGTTGHLDAPLNPLPPVNAATSKYFNIGIDGDYDGLLGGNTGALSGKLPNFTTATSGSAPLNTGSSTAGVAVWANCNPYSNLTNSNWYVHTY
jgi:prepilin-type N-terminal cleavage/methylation domain-containing protein